MPIFTSARCRAAWTARPKPCMQIPAHPLFCPPLALPLPPPLPLALALTLTLTLARSHSLCARPR
eukprot:283423-Chlamydomonas_euryale.AAC.1